MLPEDFDKDKLFSILGPCAKDIIWWNIPDEDLETIWASKVFPYKRAYIALENRDSVLLPLKDRLHKMSPLLDSRGNKYPIIPEMAPYQKIPRKVKKVDRRMNTISEDAEYKKFISELSQP